MKAAAATPTEYIAALPKERAAVVSVVRKLVKKHLPKGYTEHMNWGVIAYDVPLKILPDTYNGQPLTYVALAAQKNHYALYLMCAYMNPKLQKQLADGFKKAGKKLDMGKSCLRFKSVDDLPLDVIGKLIASTPMAEYVKCYKKAKGSK